MGRAMLSSREEKDGAKNRHSSFFWRSPCWLNSEMPLMNSEGGVRFSCRPALPFPALTLKVHLAVVVVVENGNHTFYEWVLLRAEGEW